MDHQECFLLEQLDSNPNYQLGLIESMNSMSPRHNVYNGLNTNAHLSDFNFTSSNDFDHSLSFEAIDLPVPNNLYGSYSYHTTTNHLNNNNNMNSFTVNHTITQESLQRSNSVPIFKSNEQLFDVKGSLMNTNTHNMDLISNNNNNNNNNNTIDLNNQYNNANQNSKDVYGDIIPFNTNSFINVVNFEHLYANQMSNQYGYEKHDDSLTGNTLNVPRNEPFNDQLNILNVDVSTDNNNNNTNEDICYENNNSNKQDSSSSSSLVKSKKRSSPKKAVITKSKRANQKYLLQIDEGIDLKYELSNYYCTVYTCMQRACGYEFYSIPEYKAHINMIHPYMKDDEQSEYSKFSYKCLVGMCGKKLETINKMINHICKVHLIKENSIKFASSANNSISDLEQIQNFHVNQTLFICNQGDCLRLFKNEQTLKLHKQMHRKGLIDSNQSMPLKQEKEQQAIEPLPSSQASTAKKFACQVCDKRFVRPSQLNSHLKLHENDEKSIKCDQCGECFSKTSALTTHVSQNHKNCANLYKCTNEACGKAYLSKMCLVKHMAKKHENFDFYANANNGTHQIIWVKSSDVSGANDPILAHSSSISSSPSATSSSSPTSNTSTSTNNMSKPVFKCTHDNCDKLFQTSSKLQRHLKTHLKTKVLKCTFENCTAEFSRRDHLNVHLNSHSNVKIYSCDFQNCNSKFKYWTNYITHQKSHMTKSSPIKPQKKAGSMLQSTVTSQTPIAPNTSKQPMLSSKQFDMNEFNLSEQSNLTLVKSQSNEFHGHQQVYILNADSCPATTTGVPSNVSCSLTSEQLQSPFMNYDSPAKLNIFNCDYCEYKFDTLEKLKNHLKYHSETAKQVNDAFNFISLVDSSVNSNEPCSSQFSHQFPDEQYHEFAGDDDQPSSSQSNQKQMQSNTNEMYYFPNQSANINTRNTFFDEIQANYQNIQEHDGQQATNLTANESYAIYEKSLGSNSMQSNNVDDFISPVQLQLSPSNLNDSAACTKQEHIITINSDDEEYSMSAVILENLSGSARTDYKSNHIYNEKCKIKRFNSLNLFTTPQSTNPSLVILNTLNEKSSHKKGNETVSNKTKRMKLSQRKSASLCL